MCYSEAPIMILRKDTWSNSPIEPLSDRFIRFPTPETVSSEQYVFRAAAAFSRELGELIRPRFSLCRDRLVSTLFEDTLRGHPEPFSAFCIETCFLSRTLIPPPIHPLEPSFMPLDLGSESHLEPRQCVAEIYHLLKVTKIPDIRGVVHGHSIYERGVRLMVVLVSPLSNGLFHADRIRFHSRVTMSRLAAGEP